MVSETAIQCTARNGISLFWYTLRDRPAAPRSGQTAFLFSPPDEHTEDMHPAFPEGYFLLSVSCRTTQKLPADFQSEISVLLSASLKQRQALPVHKTTDIWFQWIFPFYGIAGSVLTALHPHRYNFGICCLPPLLVLTILFSHRNGYC